jgi:hypothetical protein
MINLRYHIVSLTAVFLALGVGILAGTTVIDRGLVQGFEANTTALQNRLNTQRSQITIQERDLALWDKFGDKIIPPLVQGRLDGRATVVIADNAVPGALLNGLSETFALAGAKRPTRLTLTDKWALAAPASVEQLALLLGLKGSSKDEVLAEAASRIASRLGGSSDPRADDDLIHDLDNAGFLDVSDLPDVGPFPSSNALVILVTSGASNETPTEDAFFIPLLRVLTSARVVATTEPFGADRSLAEKVRGDRELARSVCTVDHGDTVAGQLSLVYCLRDLVAGRAAAHYGVRRGAKAVAPDVRAA